MGELHSATHKDRHRHKNRYGDRQTDTFVSSNEMKPKRKTNLTQLDTDTAKDKGKCEQRETATQRQTVKTVMR